MYLLLPGLWPALLAFLALGVPLFVQDARSFRLPLGLNLGLLGAGAVLLPLSAVGPLAGLPPLDVLPAGAAHLTTAGHLPGALVAAAAVLVLMLALFVVARGGLGFGDVILAPGLALFGGFVSPLAAFAGIWLGCLGTLVWSRARRSRGRGGPVPFGPGLIAGTALVMLVPLPGVLAG